MTWIQVAAAIGVLSLAFDLRAQISRTPDETPTQSPGTLVDGSFAKIGAGARPHTNGEALSFIYDPNLSDLERVDATIAYRKATGEDQLPNCFYGPVERRISAERLVVLSQQFAQMQRSEAWKLLLAEPEDPNLAPVKIAIRDKNGPNCPERDMNERLREERQQLLEKQSKSGTEARAIAKVPRAQSLSCGTGMTHHSSESTQ